MLAVIELGGNQFIVRKDDVIEVKKQYLEVGKQLAVEALLVSDEEGTVTKVGTPTVAGSKVVLEVLAQEKWEKIRVFKMKSKKRYMKNNWFRPHITRLSVSSIA